MILICIFACLATAIGLPSNDVKENYKDQYCTDPRTMRKHAAYTEWADAYSCTRHRCQPGGRNLAIYTVGCKRVEAPESAIECEEVVEDTNMQFPFCCTRLRCLVVVRGEVWTRVLGQPWETLPAAPWSHMYKMKKPPPTDTTFLPKIDEQGPIYELQEPDSEGSRDKVLRSAKKPPPDSTDCNEVVPRAAATPDIVIALSTTSEQQKDNHKKGENTRHKRMRKTPNSIPFFEEDHREAPEVNELEEAVINMPTEKPAEASEERFFVNSYGVTQKAPPKTQHQQQGPWTDIPQNQWNERDPLTDQETKDPAFPQAEFPPPEPEKKEERPSNLQALVDAIGTRMRDIENVVQRMSSKVQQNKPGDYVSTEKRSAVPESDQAQHIHHKSDNEGKDVKTKRPNSDEHYKRFSVKNRGSKYLHSASEATTEQPLFVEDNNMNGYFSDASNSVVRRTNAAKEPAPTYMAPVDTLHKSPPHIPVVPDTSDDDKKRKKHGHKKRKNKNGKGHKKHKGKEDKKKHFSKIASVEIDKNVVSLEDSSAVVNQ